MKKKRLFLGLGALLASVGLFGGLFWWLGAMDSTVPEEDCIYLSELSVDELMLLIEERIMSKH